MKIAVILVNYNGKLYNEACIDSILACWGERELKIFVVDNASADGSLQRLRERYGGEERVATAPLDKNYGFSYANNAGIRLARSWGADNVLLLNNDTETEPDLLSQMERCAKRHPGCVIAPKIRYSSERNRIWSAGGSFSRVIKKAGHIGLDETDEGQYDREREVSFATGCCLWIPMEVIRETGLLDERFFLYYEDTEYSFRLQRHGVSIYYCPKAVLYHKVGAGSGGADSPLCAYYIARNWLLCNRLHLGARYPLFLVYYVLNRSVCCFLWLLRGKGALVLATLRGIRDYHRGRFGRARYDFAEKTGTIR